MYFVLNPTILKLILICIIVVSIYILIYLLYLQFNALGYILAKSGVK